MIVYTRWDYVDRDTNIAHHIWTCYPDGRDPRSFHGNYPERRESRPWMEMDIRAIPGSHKFVATTGGAPRARLRLAGADRPARSRTTARMSQLDAADARGAVPRGREARPIDKLHGLRHALAAERGRLPLRLRPATRRTTASTGSTASATRS